MFILKNYACLLYASFFCLLSFSASGKDHTKEKPVIRIGIIADVHDEPQRLQAFIDKARQEKPDFIIQLGDLSNGTAGNNAEMLAVWNTYPGKKYHVLGNHEFDHATKDEIVKRQEMPAPFYSFDCGEFHFVVLDCNFILSSGRYLDYANANYYIRYPYRDLIHPEQVDWLKKEIGKTDKKVIIFSHETFDDIHVTGANPVPNRMLVRDLIDAVNASVSPNDRKVIACFAGHDHLDHYNRIRGVHYFSVNSALGFKQGLETKDALYQFVTLDNNTRTITVKGVKSKFLKIPSPDDYGPYPKSLIYPYTRNRKVKY